MYGSIADKIGQESGLHPYRRSNLRDGFFYMENICKAIFEEIVLQICNK